jgi:hypothetical protein
LKEILGTHERAREMHGRRVTPVKKHRFRIASMRHRHQTETVVGKKNDFVSEFKCGRMTELLLCGMNTSWAAKKIKISM